MKFIMNTYETVMILKNDIIKEKKRQFLRKSQNIYPKMEKLLKQKIQEKENLLMRLIATKMAIIL